MVWGYQRNRLNKIQKKAIRIITSIKYNSHTEPLFKQLNMLKLEDLLKLQQLKFYFKFNEGSLPVYLQNWDITPNARVHNYNSIIIFEQFSTPPCIRWSVRLYVAHLCNICHISLLCYVSFGSFLYKFLYKTKTVQHMFYM